MAQPTITLPTGTGANTPASVSAAINAALVAETAFIQTLPAFAQVAALAPGLDDPSNAQGLGAPAIIRGTVYGHLAAGVTLGAGQTTAVRTATLNGLQAALNIASSLGKFFELEPGTYEIYGSTGLVFPSNGIPYFKGSKSSLLSQFYANAPVFVLGDTTGAATLYGAKIDGLAVQYGVSQTGNTGACAIACGPMAWCTVENIEVTPNGTFPIINPPYIALRILPIGTWFNNCLRNIRLYGGQQSLFTQESQGSGNLFQDIYMSNGSNNNASESIYAALNGPALFVGNSSYSTMSGNVYERINIESVKCVNVMQLQECQSFAFVGLHFENLEITNSGGCLIANIGGNGEIINMDTYDIQVPSGLTGVSVLQNSGSGEMVTIDGLRMGWSTNGTGVQSPMSVIAGPGGNNDQNATVKMRGLVMSDALGSNAAECTLWNGLYPLNDSPNIYSVAVAEFESDQVQARTRSYQPYLTGTAYTHYGCHTNAVLMVPSSLTAAATITLSNKQFPSGLGSSLTTLTGNTVRVRRMSGTYQNTLTVKDAASGSTLTTNSTQGQDYLYVFNGTNWVVAT